MAYTLSSSVFETEEIRPRFSIRSFKSLRASGESEICSAIISEAPLNASSGVKTPFSSSTYLSASAFKSRAFFEKEKIHSASGSSPFSFAAEARVFLFCLNGL